ncbi:MAG: hypothetical protein J7J27_03065 [Euryarchaeota archaeon]|nr:hypothetical protein [Euryarchaeota archaeon]
MQTFYLRIVTYTLIEKNAHRLNIRPDDIIVIYNERGSIKARAQITNDVHEGVLVMYKGARHQGLSPNVLTFVLEDDYRVIAYHSTKVRVKKLNSP